MGIESLLQQAIDLLAQSHHVVVLTGAGISTPSGIPDFRTPQAGVWAEVDPMEVASIDSFRRHPERFYGWLHGVGSKSFNALPNPAHIALADLEQHGPLKSVVTQNIDALHTMAGSKTVYELHGTLRTATCGQCQANYDAHPLMQSFVETGAVPHCMRCGGVLKPDVVLYGENLPWFVLAQAQKDVQRSDLLIVAGTALEVIPSADMPMLAKRTGSKIIIINYTKTYADEFADVVIRGNVADVLPLLAEPFVSV
jgi:NAD-dependent deacetylase